jgi:CheY-like chemotaxis protein
MTIQAKQIFVVEDDRFPRCAWKVLTAADGEEALAMTRTETVDLILLDMLMPKLHGLDVMQTPIAEEKTRAIPVLILSSSSREQDVREVMQLGPSATW